jgi:hypothetical protein
MLPNNVPVRKGRKFKEERKFKEGKKEERH